MLMKQIIDAYEVLDSTYVTGEKVKEYLLGIKPDANIEVYELVGPKGSTDMLKVRIPGKNGKMNGGDAPTIGLLGRLGGIGARPERIGFVSDGDGALCAVALAAKLLDMQNKGDILDGERIYFHPYLSGCSYSASRSGSFYGLSGRNVPGKQRRGFSGA